MAGDWHNGLTAAAILQREGLRTVCLEANTYARGYGVKDIVVRHITFAPYHVNTMFSAPAGDFCRGLLHPDLMGPNRPEPKGFLDLPIPIAGLSPHAGIQRRLSSTRGCVVGDSAALLHLKDALAQAPGGGVHQCPGALSDEEAWHRRDQVDRQVEAHPGGVTFG